MLNKTLILLATASVLSCATAAFAVDDPENRIGDRYPFLEQAAAPVRANIIGNRNLIARQIARVDQFSNEDVENKIADRYPLLEQIASPVAATKLGDRYLMRRQAANLNQLAYEEPENRIGDRYPLLEVLVTSQRGLTGYVTARRALTTGSIH